MDSFWSGFHVTDVIVAFAAIIGVCVAFAQLLTYRMQADLMQGQLEATILAQRARIQITPSWETNSSPSQYNLGQTPPTPEYKFGSKVDNVGQMPAANLKNRIDYLLVPGEIPDDFDFRDSAPPLAKSGVLGTRQFFLGPHIPVDRYVTVTEMGKIQREELHLYLFGWVRYSDGFLNTPERITTFCYRVRVTGNPSIPVVFIPHEQHNHSD